MNQLHNLFILLGWHKGESPLFKLTIRYACFAVITLKYQNIYAKQAKQSRTREQ